MTAGRSRVEFLSEKNRRAQKRYRERQRERFADFKKQVEGLTQQVKSLKQDKECLQSRNELLENMMEEELKCAGGATRALTTAPVVDAADPLAGTDVENYALGMDDVCRSLLKNLPQAQAQLILPLNGSKLYGFEDLVVLYQALCSEFARLLANGAEDPSSKLHPELLRMHHIHINEVARHFEKRPVLLRRIQMASKYGDGTEAIWQKAAATLDLMPAQVEQIVAAREAFRVGLIGSVGRRRACLGTLSMSSIDCITSEGRLAELFLKEIQAADLAKATLMEEHALRNTLANDIRKALTPAQYCRWTVEIYPHASDWLALAHAVECLHRGAPTSLASVLASSRTGPPPPSFSDDVFEDLSDAQATDFLQEFDFLQSTNAGAGPSASGLLPPTDPMLALNAVPACPPFSGPSHALARG
ncbi:hypothetical protein WJX84_007648 [Apatococcus fuscideae]|uniref:BZIP domain-containing protein n=1 Tax=Apatococcus fuscideae TaxID=2026836 RepID=A0AAW1TB05_9CHLO